MGKKKTVLAFIDTQWAIGRIFKDLHPLLQDEFQIFYYDWAKYKVEQVTGLLDWYDIFITNLVNIPYFMHLPEHKLRKMIFCCHGYPELINLQSFSFPEGPIYTIVSNQIRCLFPDELRQKLLLTCNGVSLQNFHHIQRDGSLNIMGWVGATHVELKRSNWCESIAEQTQLSLCFASDLSYDELKEWYTKIDILLINSGPNTWQETGPLPAFEAIASGILVIGTRVGNFAEIPGPKYSNIDEAVEIIHDLKKNPEKVRQIASEQYNCVKNNWTYEILSQQWRKVYHMIKKER